MVGVTLTLTSLLAVDLRSLSHRNEIEGSATHDQMVHKKTTNKAVESFQKVLCQSVCHVPNHSPTVLCCSDISYVQVLRMEV